MRRRALDRLRVVITAVATACAVAGGLAGLLGQLPGPLKLGGQLATVESSWIEKGGMQLRHELVGSAGRLVTDTSSTPVWGFVSQPAGYLVEKADSDTGWVFPVPEEARAYGFSQEMRHFVRCFAAGVEPEETFVDGWVVNVILDACYASMKSGSWEGVDLSG